MAHRSDVHRILLDACRRAGVELLTGCTVNQVAVFGSPAFARGDAEWGGPDELDAAFAGCCQHVKAALPSLWRDWWWPMYGRLLARQWCPDGSPWSVTRRTRCCRYLAQGAC